MEKGGNCNKPASSSSQDDGSAINGISSGEGAMQLDVLGKLRFCSEGDVGFNVLSFYSFYVDYGI